MPFQATRRPTLSFEVIGLTKGCQVETRHPLPFNEDCSMKSAESENTSAGAYYILRIRKRDAKLASAILFLWFLWSQAADLSALFRGLFDSLG